MIDSEILIRRLCGDALIQWTPRSGLLVNGVASPRWEAVVTYDVNLDRYTLRLDFDSPKGNVQ